MGSREAGTQIFYISAKHDIKSFILEYIYNVQNCIGHLFICEYSGQFVMREVVNIYDASVNK